MYKLPVHVATVRCKVQQDNMEGKSTFITPVKSIWNISFWNFSFFHFIESFSPSRHSVIFLELLLCEKEQQIVYSRDSKGAFICNDTLISICMTFAFALCLFIIITRNNQRLRSGDHLSNETYSKHNIGVMAFSL